ncbi:hypothetical protein MLD38_023007 [Melastoma candidum]|uniref:Uncharacterized protein n=1 Tax=Melastoma candidum TaxID=119954 RepID=A0ACB9QLB2_9MYRT|nr:hypothetical protein MLD38_023007 [Melastoma candidum]
MEQRSGNFRQKPPRTSSSGKVMIGEDDTASRLVGSIVEKGVSGDGQKEPPRPSVVPFPVARHRSHGPHWGPITARKGLDGNDSDDLDEDDEEDRRIASSEKLAAFADPVQRKEKRGLDFRNLREVVSSEISSAPHVGRKQSFEVNGARDNKNKMRTKVSSEKSLSIATSAEESASRHWVSMKAMLDRGEELGNQTEVGSANIFNDVRQANISLESEIDTENRARLESMSPDEIAEAQSEIREKLNPQLLEILRNRGRAKSKSQYHQELIACNETEVVNLTQNEKVVNAEASSTSRNHLSHPPRKETMVDNQNAGPDEGKLWNAWSARVETVRNLRFSLEGDVIGVVGPDDKHGSNSQLSSDVAERDLLRTEGDPGALGYTIREAVALTRSVVPAQRALALHLLASVLAKAINNICCEHKDATCGRSIDESRNDWEAIWAFTLGPEPELALALRMCLDDNHNSVLLACAKIIQCAMNSELNEKVFNYWEMMDVHGRGTCTAPVFRSKKSIEEGFLPGGFWKYSAKPSNMLSISKASSEDSEEPPTIQDDLIVAGQDFATGLVRMGILPRIRYLLETEATAVLEESLLSILIAISRHSPVAADAVVECPMLIETIVSRFTMESNKDFNLCKIEYVVLFKVLAGSNKKHCLEFLRSGKIQALTWHLYQSSISLDHWIRSGKENVKFSSKLMVEQLRLLRACISFGHCVADFKDIFPVICLWLSFPPMEKLVHHDIVTEYLSVSAEAYLVLCALAGRLPNLHEQRNTICQVDKSDITTWSWSFVSPMVDIAMKWIEMKGDPLIARFFELPGGETNMHEVQTLSSLLWVYSAIIQMMHTIFEKVGPCRMVTMDDDAKPVPWLPEFIPKITLDFIRNGFLGSFNGRSAEEGTLTIASVLEALCNLRRHGQYDISLASVCCLWGLIHIMEATDNLIQLARVGAPAAELNGESHSVEERILEGGLIKGSLVDLENMVIFFSDLVASEWMSIRSVEKFGRGGPAPGLGVGWGAPEGGYWSPEVMLAQKDADILVTLLGMLPFARISEVVPRQHEMLTLQHINGAIFSCSTVLPGNTITVEKAVDFLLQVPILNYLCVTIQRFISANSRSESVGLIFQEDELHHFSKLLSIHYRCRWLHAKKKKALASSAGTITQRQRKKHMTLNTIDEEIKTSEELGSAEFTELMVQWTYQRLPLPIHWFLSPLSTMPDPPEVVKAGLFFFLGLEAISCAEGTANSSPIELVPLVWKVHSLSATLLTGMVVLDDQRIRVIYKVLQDHFGQILDKMRSEPETGKKNFTGLLRFQSEIHGSYSTFIEAIIDQFAAESYGDALFGRQVAIYLHQDVESSIRLTTWNVLSNARVLELLPPLHECVGTAEGYLEPPESDERVLEAYVKSWVSGALDRAATRRSMAFTLFLHHISLFIFRENMEDHTPFRNRLVKSMLRQCSVKHQYEGVMLDLIRYVPSDSRILGQDEACLSVCYASRRFQVLRDASEGNSSLMAEVDRLTSTLTEDEFH